MPGIGNIRAKKFGKIGFAAVDTDAKQVAKSLPGSAPALAPEPVGAVPTGTVAASRTVPLGLSDNQNTVVAEVVDRALDLIEQKGIRGPQGPAGIEGPQGPAGNDASVLDYDVGDLTLYFDNRLI